MLATALWITGVSTVSFMLAVLVTGRELRRGKRFCLVNARDGADVFVSSVAARFRRITTYITRHVITLSWYYSIHSFLKVVLQLLAYCYHKIESVLVRNRMKAKQIRKERKAATVTHLTAIAEHKAETTLSAAEQKKLRDKTLAGKY
jgi:hypothetical protein